MIRLESMTPDGAAVLRSTEHATAAGVLREIDDVLYACARVCYRASSWTNYLTPAVPYFGAVANICENPHRRNNAKRPWGTAFDSAPIIATTALITPSRGCSSITF